MELNVVPNRRQIGFFQTRDHLRSFVETRQPLIWIIALLVGFTVAFAAILFRELIGVIQLPWLGTRSERVFSAASTLSWYWIIAAPITGGLVVGPMLICMNARRVGTVPDVIEAVIDPDRKLDLRDGLLSSIVTAVSLGSGASAGREGPVVHLGAVLATAIAARSQMPKWSHETLLGAGVASAIAASFNAPIAGVLFAHEVILGHYAKRAFVPIVIASTAGSVVSRIWFGNSVAFAISDYSVRSLWEFPAFALLGLLAAIVAMLFQYTLARAESLSRDLPIPLWLQPVTGGVLLGAIAVPFPEVLGVGYEVTDLAVSQMLPLDIMLVLIVLKIIATAVSLAARFGGGVFSPALYLGALTGGSFGVVWASVVPELASTSGLYAILGMGAVAGAVLGAPLSSTVIVFELTGGYTLSIVLLFTVSLSHGIAHAFLGRSWFCWQLQQRGRHTPIAPVK
ncbi:chloride channel protein [Sinorhizobium mexicanum]|uniref:Chloride channel protein n=1 Tax=Sinorhizobium mexicanum TaxID=375549 RepID=A0A859QE87_9HYPH|nr:chloride channel protein [Sinorhizobium mexicanum]MBP1888277.1 CIC family chloride channel protein [Sinorhizobium mexicanum]QLL64073.1 chloride channel protein [Sinorhizobium mexicanum]